MKPLVTDKLVWHHCTALADVLDTDDASECIVMGLTPIQALASGALLGYAQAAMRMDGSVAGAFGYTSEGTIWSLWSPLTRSEQLQVFRETPDWVTQMVSRSGRDYLYNYVPASSQRTLDWLYATEVFDIYDSPHALPGGTQVHYFETLRSLARGGRSPCVTRSR